MSAVREENAARATATIAPGNELPYRVLVATVCAVLVPILILSQITAHWRTDVVDDQMFGFYGWRIAHGATVYLDVWDNKPPGIYWINALGMLVGGDSYGGVIALCAAAAVVALACFFVIAASIFHRGAAALATVLAGFYLTHGEFQCGTNRTETFLVACELLAVALYVRGFARDAWWKFYVAGILCGCAFMFKQVGLAAWGAMGLHTIILVAFRDMDWRTGLRRCLLLAGGLLSTLLLVSGVLAFQGAFKEAVFATFGFNRSYMAIGRSALMGSYENWYRMKENVWPILQLPVLMSATALIHTILWRLRPLLNPQDVAEQLEAQKPVCPRYMLLFAVWFAVAYYGGVFSPHAFSHYVVPSLPPLMLMSGYLINVLRAEQRLLVRFQQRAWIAAAFVAIVYFASTSVYRHFQVLSSVWLQRIEMQERADWELIGEAVASVTDPQDRIQCWGYQPGVYLFARRPNACRYSTTEKIGQVREEADFIKKELYETLMADPPVLIVIGNGDYNSMHGIEPNKPRRAPEAMALWIDDHYTRIHEVRETNTYLYKRNDKVKASTAP